MSYNSLINTSLTLAFKQLKDLAVDFVYNKKASSEFNFNTSTVSETVETFTAKTVVIEKIKNSKDRAVVSMQLLANTKDIGSISNFDSVVYQGETWIINENLKDNGFVSLFTVVKES
jgi:hypothetical protein